MNCYNSEQYLKEAIESVLNQSYNNYEIIFWDNASTDNSANIVKSYNDKRIKYFSSKKTVVVSKARNFALEKCSGEFIAFLDCDDIWMDSKLEKQVKLFSDKEVGLVFSNSIFFNKNGDIKKNYGYFKPKDGESFKDLLKKYHLDIETVMIRKSILDKHKLKFHDNLNFVSDAHLFMRVSLVAKLSYHPDVLAKWRIHETQQSTKYKLQFYDEVIYMLDDLRNKYFERNTEFHKFFFRAQDKAMQKKIFYIWQLKGPKKAQEFIRNTEKQSTKLKFIYFLTLFVPFSLIYRVSKIIN